MGGAERCSRLAAVAGAEAEVPGRRQGQASHTPAERRSAATTAGRLPPSARRQSATAPPPTRGLGDDTAPARPGHRQALPAVPACSAALLGRTAPVARGSLVSEKWGITECQVDRRVTAYKKSPSFTCKYLASRLALLESLMTFGSVSVSVNSLR